MVRVLEGEGGPLQILKRRKSGKKLLEKKIEGDVRKWAIKRGWRVKKLNGMHDRGWPDRLFVANNFTAFIEFKAEGETPTELQADTIAEFKKLGQNVNWFDDSDEAIRWLEKLERKYAAR